MEESPRRSPRAGQSDCVRVTKSPLEKVYIVEMNGPAANVLSADLMAGLLAAIREVCDPDAETRCEGLVLTSAVPGVFSGELDRNELRSTSQESFAHYWGLFQRLFITLHSLPVPLAVAVNGDTAAGGAVVALAADYRVMARTRYDGKPIQSDIAAARYGLVMPPYVAGSLEHVVGFRRAEDLLVNGVTLSADEAHRVGLVDAVVECHDEAVVPCLEYMERILSLPSPLPFWVVKDVTRRRLLAPLCTEALRTADTANFFAFMQSPSVRR